MKLNCNQRTRLVNDIGLNKLSMNVSDKSIPVENCWHFSSDGRCVDSMFYDDEDFKSGMNRVYILSKKYNVIILAFILMDTHFHFVLYGEFDECQRFAHEFLRQTSQNLMLRHKDSNKLLRIPLSHQTIDNHWYLKTVISYVLKNAPVGGLRATYYDYPWSSGALYFRCYDGWTSPFWTKIEQEMIAVAVSSSRRGKKAVSQYGDRLLPDGIVFPGDYVAYEEVELLYRTHRSFNYFICKVKDEDVESIGGAISRLSFPIQELRQKRQELCDQYFGGRNVRRLNAEERLHLARTMKSRFRCSVKQIARICCLKYEEIVDLI